MKNYKGMGLLKSNRLKKSYQNDLSGFTLAEVLITLGIIGVVAAMVIPTLISNIQGAVFRAKFKKTVATLNQAVKLNKARYGWDFADFPDNGRSSTVNDNPEFVRTKYSVYNGSLKGHTPLQDAPSYVKPLSGKNIRHVGASFRNVYWGSLYVGGAIQMMDGVIFAFNNHHHRPCIKELGVTSSEFADNDLAQEGGMCLGYIDVNGEAGPNRETVCDNASGNPLDYTGKISGTNSIGWVNFDSGNPCKVTSKTIGDQFPVVFHDDVVEPASNAAAAVLGSTK